MEKAIISITHRYSLKILKRLTWGYLFEERLSMAQRTEFVIVGTAKEQFSKLQQFRAKWLASDVKSEYGRQGSPKVKSREDASLERYRRANGTRKKHRTVSLYKALLCVPEIQTFRLISVHCYNVTYDYANSKIVIDYDNWIIMLLTIYSTASLFVYLIQVSMKRQILINRHNSDIYF